MKLKKFIAMMAVTAMVAGMATGCGGSKSDAGSDSTGSDTKTESLSGTITAAGSSALKPLADDAADSFLNENPDVSITIDAGGSGEGLKQVSEGTVDIGNSDVAAEDKLDADKAKELVDHQVCVITMAPIVNEDVAKAGVKSLTKDQLISIFTGKTTNWKEVGGPDEDIVLVTRPGSMETDDSGVLLTNVKDTKGAIGYVALSYLTGDAGVETVAIDGVEPTLENTYSGEYPVWTFEHMYTKGEPNEVVSAFLDYITGDKYGSQMEKLGYGVSSKMTKTEH